MKVIEKQFGHQNPRPIISVIIVAYKTNLELKDCLGSLGDQVYKNFETIVVDNDSEDIKSLEQFSMRYFRLDKNYGPSYARNFGAKKAKGSLLAFLDDDAIADKLWTTNIFNAFKIKSTIGIRGKIMPKSLNNIYNLLPKHYDLGDLILDSPLTTEGNSVVRRKEFLDIGGFNTKLFGHEGVDLSYRLSNSGRQIYIPNVIIYHDFGDNLRHFIKKQYRHGRNMRLIPEGGADISMYNKQFNRPPMSQHSPSISTKIRLIAITYLGIGADIAGKVICKLS